MRLCLLGFLLTQVCDSVAPPFWPRFGGDRQVELLDGQWQYGLHLDADFDSMSPQFDPLAKSLTPNTTQVPSSMDAAPPGIAGPRGVAMYRTEFKQTGQARLQFLACSFYCRVFVDGHEIGDHRAGGYVPWWVDVPAPKSGIAGPVSRELFVLADNRFNSTTAPMHTGGDFWHYGGLMRSVVLHDLPDKAGEVWPWRAYVFPASSDQISITVKLTDPLYSGDVKYALSFDGSATTSHSTAQAKQGSAELGHFKVPNAHPWTLQDPHMHLVEITVGNASITERFGLRFWTVEDDTSRIALNGKAVKLHGWNHHTQWPENGGIGASPTDTQLDDDIRLLKEAGTNYVRGAHYPQDQRWLDRLDEAGMAMWEETLGPSTSKENLTDWTFFMKYQLQQLDEMMDQSLNHPSIMTWGWFNEGPSDDENVCPAYAACAKHAQKRDPTRFVTWATSADLNDKCLEHASLISFNNYPAWYVKFGDLTEPARIWNEMANTVRATYPGHPFVISETGAGGVYEWSHNSTDAKWTTKYQTEVISRDVDVALANTNISGITLWHFFDFKGNDAATLLCGPCDYLPGVEPPTCAYVNVNCSRPGGLNHKGVVDPWRRKKEVYNVVAAKYNAVEANAIPLVV